MLAHQKQRPVVWLVVVLIISGFAVAGAGLALAQPWLFFVGVAAIVVGSSWGWVVHIMADQGS